MSHGESPAIEKITLHRTLGRWQLTLIGVSNAVGAGILVLSGTMAANYAGPAAALSFVIAGAVCLLVALCYAELAAMMPDAGSAYTYAKLSLGRFGSWLIGWCLILGYLVAASTVAVGWSGYLGDFVANFGWQIAPQFLSAPTTPGGWFNLPAMLITLLCTALLVRGIRESANFNAIMVGLKLAAIGLFVVTGLFFINADNWQPFIPPAEGDPVKYGWSGVFAGAVLAFFSFTGFEVISTSTQEAKNPKKDIPFALMASFTICAVFYISTTLVMTGIVPFRLLDNPSPLSLALQTAGPSLAWLKMVISTLIVIGLPSAVLVSLYGQSRIFVVMSEDNLLPSLFRRVDKRFRTPVAGTMITGVLAALIAGLFPLEVIGELVSMGLLFCFAIVCLAVIVLRQREPQAERPFRVPLYPVVPILGIVSCVYLIFSLPVSTWSRLAVWLACGIALYVFYCRKKAA